MKCIPSVSIQSQIIAGDCLVLSNNRYKGGVANYLEVLTAQSTSLTNQRIAIGILRRRLTASVSLIQALGGWWNASTLPVVQNSSNSAVSHGQ
jgi:outer membrane protein TolC